MPSIKVHDPICEMAFSPDLDEKLSRCLDCELIERARADERKFIIEVIEELPCRCEEGKDYCDGHTDVINAIEEI